VADIDRRIIDDGQPAKKPAAKRTRKATAKTT
jgi:hypothetical protein